MSERLRNILSNLSKRMDTSILFLFCMSLLCSAGFILLFSRCSTPLYPYVMGDPSVWTMIGRGITQGYVPYEDLYDHKGPLQFFIYALGAWISHGKLGLYLVEVTAMAVSLAACFRIARLFVSPTLSLLSALGMLLYCCATFDMGGTTEEYSLTFILWPIYWLLKHVVQRGAAAKIPLWLWVAIGFGGGAVTMIRMNNSALLCGMVPAALYFCLRYQGVASLLRAGLGLVAGFAVAVVPFILYFWYHGAMDMFVQGCFLHNFSYASNGAVGKTGRDWMDYALRIIPSILLLILLWREVKREELRSEIAITITAGAILTLFVLQIGNGYFHYFMIQAPLYALLICFLFRSYRRRVNEGEMSGRRACTMVSLWSLIVLVPLLPSFLNVTVSALSNNRSHLFDRKYEVWYKGARELAEQIPPADRNKVWGMDEGLYTPEVYIYMNAVPCYRYFSVQFLAMSSLPNLECEIREYLKAHPPLYIIDKDVPFLREFIGEHYEPVKKCDWKDGTLTLYKLKK